MTTTVETAQKLGLLPEEFDKITEILGRTPNFTELSAYSVMWSEHCSYKNSIVWLKKLPKSKAPQPSPLTPEGGTENPSPTLPKGEGDLLAPPPGAGGASGGLLVEAGQENAGMVDIGDGLACVFKIESHNHPSAIEPYQGAATGVGGINRDIFTMGARPIAQLNTLRFGDIKNERTKYLMKGVVKGIGDYGNAFGVPTVGGEVFFDPCYQTNPLVNAFSAGIVQVGKTASATSYGAGNPVFIVGSATGKDGIHGAAFASKDITEDSAKDLPSVQVGDPFQEKLLLEATLEIIDAELVIGVQDMGAAGIICSTSEMSAKGESGMVINLDKVPLRQANMTAWEILLSESQERMLVVGKKGYEKETLAIFEKWDLHCVQIGEVVDGDTLQFYQHGELVAEMPAESLVLGGGAPVYHREWKEPAYYQEFKKFDINSIPEPKDLAEYQKIVRHLLAHPNICSKRWVYEQYDSMVGTANASTNTPADAAVVLVKGTDKAIVITVDCNGRYVHADPEIGAMIAVCESARNVVCAGGEPVAITNNLNFGNPYNPEVYWQFVGAIQGMIKACERLNTPVTGGNVSFYNQYTPPKSPLTPGGGTKILTSEGSENEAPPPGAGGALPVFPTPTIGMLGLMEDLNNKMTLDFKNVGDLIYLIGTSRNDINCSEYLYSYHQVKASPVPYFDLEEEAQLQEVIKQLIRTHLIESAHDVSDGGLFIALAESAMVNGLGFDLSPSPSPLTPEGGTKDIPVGGTKDSLPSGKGEIAPPPGAGGAFLFGESQSRVVVSVNPAIQHQLEAMMEKLDFPFSLIGKVTEKDFVIHGETFITTEEAKDLYDNSLGRELS